jgi:ADP-ribose pyrophosphatase YjhB (NUDIX family)
MDGTAHGAEDVRAIVVAARELYENQEFKFAGPLGDYGFVEDYTTDVRGEHISVIVLVTFNADRQTQRVVVNHRPRSGLLFFFRMMLEKFAGTPLPSTGKAHRKSHFTASHREGSASTLNL